MNKNKAFIHFRFCSLILIFLFLLLPSCNRPVKSTDPTNTETTLQTVTEQITPTIQPTPTPPPLAASVNDEDILLEFINNEILRYLMAYPDSSISNAFDIVIQNQIDLLLLAQSARESGFMVTDELLDERIEFLVNQLGSEDQLEQWITDNYYTLETFRQTLQLVIEAEHQRFVIADMVPTEMEQFELSQILVYDETTALQIQSALDTGTEFDWLVSQYHPTTRGYLGWHAPGTLLQPILEDVVFTMDAGQVSTAIQTEYGYHFIKVLSKGVHPLSITNRQTLEQIAIQKWLKEQHELSDIRILATVEE